MSAELPLPYGGRQQKSNELDYSDAPPKLGTKTVTRAGVDNGMGASDKYKGPPIQCMAQHTHLNIK